METRDTLRQQTFTEIHNINCNCGHRTIFSIPDNTPRFIDDRMIDDLCGWAHWRHTCPDNVAQTGQMITSIRTNIYAKFMSPHTALECRMCHSILGAGPVEFCFICSRTTSQIHFQSALTTRTQNIFVYPDGSTMIQVAPGQTRAAVRPKRRRISQTDHVNHIEDIAEIEEKTPRSDPGYTP